MAREDLGDLGRIIERLEARGRLIRVTSEVDPVLISPKRSISRTPRRGSTSWRELALGGLPPVV